MAEKKYPLNGWIPPVWDLTDADYCEYGCPMCRGARRGSRLAKIGQWIELAVTFGGCPWGRARRRKHGVKPNEPLPPSDP